MSARRFRMISDLQRLSEMFVCCERCLYVTDVFAKWRFVYCIKRRWNYLQALVFRCAQAPATISHAVGVVQIMNMFLMYGVICDEMIVAHKLSQQSFLTFASCKSCKVSSKRDSVSDWTFLNEEKYACMSLQFAIVAAALKGNQMQTLVTWLLGLVEGYCDWCRCLVKVDKLS